MKKRFWLTCAIAALAVMVSASSASAATLYDQLAAPMGALATQSQDDPTAPTSRAQAADDFIVPAGVTWKLTEVDVAGQQILSASSAPVNVFLYANNGTVPGAQIFAQTGITAANYPNYNVPLTGAPQLAPGTYWVSVQVSASAGVNGIWGWTDTTQHGNKAAFQNPPGGFAPTCTSWTVRANCPVSSNGVTYSTDTTNPDQAFRLLGTSTALPPAAPSNAFTIGKPKLNRKKGTAKEPVTLPGPGELTLSGKGVSSVSHTVTVAGTVNLTVKPKGKTKKKLKKSGKAKVKVTITFTPTGGSANAQSATIKLKKKLG